MPEGETVPIACVFVGGLVHCYYQFVEWVFPTPRCDGKVDHVLARRCLERLDKALDGHFPAQLLAGNFVGILNILIFSGTYWANKWCSVTWASPSTPAVANTANHDELQRKPSKYSVREGGLAALEAGAVVRSPAGSEIALVPKNKRK